jgi:hypothetical protein
MGLSEFLCKSVVTGCVADWPLRPKLNIISRCHKQEERCPNKGSALFLVYALAEINHRNTSRRELGQICRIYPTDREKW